MNVAAIPAELRAVDQWVAWKAVPNEAKGKPDKIPFQAVNTTVKASSTDRDTWATFEQAVAALDRPGSLASGSSSPVRTRSSGSTSTRSFTTPP